MEKSTEIYCEKCPEDNRKLCPYYGTEEEKCYEYQVYRDAWDASVARIIKILEEFVAPIKNCERANQDPGMEPYLLGQIECVDYLIKNIGEMLEAPLESTYTFAKRLGDKISKLSGEEKKEALEET